MWEGKEHLGRRPLPPVKRLHLHDKAGMGSVTRVDL